MSIRRSDWARMGWQSAQEAVVKLLQDHGYMVFNEKRVYNGRVDGVVIRKTPGVVYIGIIEVKHYKKVSNSVREKAMFQSLKYLRSVFDDMSRRYPAREQHYFLATVFTNDYPTSGNSLFVSKFMDHVPEFIKQRAAISILSCTPDQLVRSLRERNLIQSHQQNLDEFFS